MGAEQSRAGHEATGTGVIITNIIIVVGLIVLNGFFAMSELAVVSARKSRLNRMAENGSRGARRAVKLAEDPTGFLSTVQVGITLVGIFAGAFGGSAFSAPLAEQLRLLPGIGHAIDGYAEDVAFVLVVIAITYASLIVGELAPKRFALAHSERIAAAVAPIMTMLARIGAPIVWLLRVSTNAVTAPFVSRSDEDEQNVTEEDVRAMIAEGTRRGVFKPKEREMLEGVIRVADRTIRSIMIPRPSVIWLDRQDDETTLLAEVLASGHSRFPILDTERDDVVGIVQAKDLLAQQRRDQELDLEAALKTPLYVHETMPILKLLDRFRTDQVHMAIVLDEYGAFEGIVTPTDILIAIAGALPEGHDDMPSLTRRKDGTFLADGSLAIDRIEHALPSLLFPAERDYTTVAGFVLDRLGHIPEVGETITHRGWTIEVVDLDGHRIDKLLISPSDQAREADEA